MKPAEIMGNCTGLVAVWLQVEPAQEDEFNAWYRFEHMQDMIGLTGFVSARRYVADWLYPKYLALYETEDETAEPGPDFARVMNHPTPWSARIRKYYGENRIRHNYKRIGCAMRDGDPYGKAILMLQSSAAPGKAAEVEAWFEANAAAALEVAGCTAARFYRTVSGSRGYLELYEFADADALLTRAWHRYAAEKRQGVAQHLVDSLQQRYCALGMELTR